MAEEQGVHGHEERIGGVAVEAGEKHDLGGDIDGLGAPRMVGGHGPTVQGGAGQPLDVRWTRRRAAG